MLPAALLCVVGFHDLLADVAAAGDTVIARSPGRILDEASNAVADLAFAPLQVVGTVFLDIADRDNLDVRAGEYSADFADCLRSEADARESNLLARRDVS